MGCYCRRRSQSGYQGKRFKAYGCLLCPSAYPPAAPLELLPGRGGWDQAEHVTRGRSRHKNSVFCEWEVGVSMQPCRSALFGCVLPQWSLRAKPAVCHVDLSCCAPWFEQCAYLCKDMSSGFPVLLIGREDLLPYTGNTGVNAVMFLRFLSLCVRLMVSSARTNSLCHSLMY